MAGNVEHRSHAVIERMKMAAPASVLGQWAKMIAQSASFEHRMSSFYGAPILLFLIMVSASNSALRAQMVLAPGVTGGNASKVLKRASISN